MQFIRKGADGENGKSSHVVGGAGEPGTHAESGQNIDLTLHIEGSQIKGITSDGVKKACELGKGNTIFIYTEGGKGGAGGKGGKGSDGKDGANGRDASRYSDATDGKDGTDGGPGGDGGDGGRGGNSGDIVIRTALEEVDLLYLTQYDNTIGQGGTGGKGGSGGKGGRGGNGGSGYRLNT